jgi:hypothetical protein
MNFMSCHVSDGLWSHQHYQFNNQNYKYSVGKRCVHHMCLVKVNYNDHNGSSCCWAGRHQEYFCTMDVSKQIHATKCIIIMIYLSSPHTGIKQEGSYCTDSSKYVYTLTAFKLSPDILGRKKGSFFYKDASPSKIGLIDPYWDTVCLHSKARVFLSSWNKQKLLCMGRTYTGISPYLLKNCPNSLRGANTSE